MISNSIKLNGSVFDLNKSKQKLTEKLPQWEIDIFTFLVDWFSNDSHLSVQTSGSTGKPNHILKQKNAFINSAIMTGDFFNFKSHKSALLCLPAKYIAGKMMLVRAIEWQLNLDYIEPKILLDFPNKRYYFCAMTPPQAEKNIDHLHQFSNLIIGGAPIKPSFERAISSTNTKCYATYGMTETLSHIALREITTQENNEYQILPNTSISTDKRDCLVITAKMLTSKPIITNDLVTITSEKTFYWNGRIDNIINSGGVKIIPENIESKISNLIDSPFFISGLKDNKWGEKVVLLIEGNETNSQRLISDIGLILTKIETPKEVFYLDKFTRTGNGKLKRAKTIDRLDKLI